MKDYLVQIVIPVYNAEKTLPRCLDSLKAQTFTQWQAILVDDVSTDGSAAVIQQYAETDSRFRYIKNEKNSGASRTRNAALGYVDAEYLAFLDSDDFWEPTMLEVLYGKMVEHDADVVQGRYIYDFSDGKQVLPTGAFPSDALLEGKGLRKVFRRMMTGINMNHVWVKLIKTSVIGDLRFDTTLPTAEDLDFCVKFFKNVKRYYFTTEILYHYYRHAGTLTGSGLSSKVKLQCNRRVSRVMLANLRDWGINTPWYIMLALLRPYIIIVSKIFRMAREKIVMRRQKQEENI